MATVFHLFQMVKWTNGYYLLKDRKCFKFNAPGKKKSNTVADRPTATADTITFVFFTEGARIISAATVNSLRAFDFGHSASGTGQFKYLQISSNPNPF